jgi:hypothetical protein
MNKLLTGAVILVGVILAGGTAQAAPKKNLGLDGLWKLRSEQKNSALGLDGLWKLRSEEKARAQAKNSALGLDGFWKTRR